MITMVVAAFVFIPLGFRPASLISDIVIRLSENYYTSIIMLLIFLFVYSITVVRVHVCKLITIVTFFNILFPGGGGGYSDIFIHT